jgi:hypothetical protein
MLGYGGTSKPTEAKEYTTKKLCADLAALLDLLGVRKAVGYAFQGSIERRLTPSRYSLVMTGALTLLAVLRSGIPIVCLP